MKTFLDRMRDLKRDEITRRQSATPIEVLRSQASTMPPAPSFKKALTREAGAPLSLIAEVKARAPGRENVSRLEPAAVVRDYVAGGAKAISVLTDQTWFGGSLEILEEVKKTVSAPLLHKDFLISSYQLLEGRVRGTSAALVLAYYFNESELGRMLEDCKMLGLEPVVECSLEEELPRALAVDPDVLMINNRPIAAIPENPSGTYQQGSVEVTLDWWKRSPELQKWKTRPGRILVSASCVDSYVHIRRLMEVPCDACLVGNAAMTATDRVAFLKSLRGEIENHSMIQDS